MNTDQITTFILLSKLKNFTRTAEQLYVAQSTVTNRIAELEAETGRKLFYRGQGGVELTGDGALFLTYAVRIRDLEESFIGEVNAASRYESKLRIGCINAAYESGLYPLVHQFFTENREVAVKVVLGHSADLLQMLQDGVIDVAFCYLSLKKAGYVCRRFLTDRLVLLASPERNEFKNGIRKAELAGCEYIFCDFAFGQAEAFVRTMFPPRHSFRFEIDNSSKALRYLSDGAGYSFLPYKMAEKEIAEGRLEIVRPLDFSVPEIVCHCSYRAGNRLAERLAVG